MGTQRIETWNIDLRFTSSPFEKGDMKISFGEHTNLLAKFFLLSSFGDLYPLQPPPKK